MCNRCRMGVDRWVQFAPVRRPRLGMLVWWWKTFHVNNSSFQRRLVGRIEIIQKRKKLVVVRDRYDHQHVVEVKDLIVPKPT